MNKFFPKVSSKIYKLPISSSISLNLKSKASFSTKIEKVPSDLGSKASLSTKVEKVPEITSGKIFEHYKGSRYQILNISTHTETEEILVIYTNISKPDNKIWARPINMFVGTVKINDNEVQRFKPVITPEQ
jgi:hypothetical protein